MPQQSAATIWADGPAGMPSQPSKSDIRAWGTWVENSITAFMSSGGKVYATRANLYADLLQPANTLAWVMSDPTPSFNGIYRKNGAPASGSWTRLGDLPYSFIIASDTGDGTPNAIKASSSIPISASALIWFQVFEPNTGSPVTVSFNDGSPLTIKTNGGNDPLPGGLSGIVLGIASGTTFRLLSDQASATVLAAAEAAAAQAQDYANLALNNQVLNTFAGNGVQTIFTLSIDPGAKANTAVNIAGALQLKSSYTISGTTLTFSEPPPGNGVDNNIEVTFGGRININVPGSETVDADKIKATDVTAIRTKLSVYSKSEVDAAVAVSAGFAGHLFGLSGSQNGTDANNDMDFAAGEAASSGSSPIIMALASALTKRSDAAWTAGNNNGAMDTGTKPTNGWLHWYLIKRPDTGVTDVCCSASALAPSVGTNIPAAYTKYRRIRSTRTDGSGNIIPDSQKGDEILWSTTVRENGGAAYSSGTSGALVALAGVPSGFKVEAILNATFNSTADTNGALVNSPDEADQATGVSGAGTNVGNMQNSGGEYASAPLRIRTNASGQVRHRSGAAGSLYLFTRGYVDDRGRI